MNYVRSTPYGVLHMSREYGYRALVSALLWPVNAVLVTACQQNTTYGVVRSAPMFDVSL
jgi:hypothetical protein